MANRDFAADLADIMRQVAESRDELRETLEQAGIEIDEFFQLADSVPTAVQERVREHLSAETIASCGTTSTIRRIGIRV